MIDLTDSSEVDGRGPSAGGVPVQWFDRRWGRAVDPVPDEPLASAAPSVVPRRVRGAQLPDLGPAAEPMIARPDDGPGAAESLRWQLRSFQLDVQAARRTISESDPVNTSEPAARAEPINGHHHPEGE